MGIELIICVLYFVDIFVDRYFYKILHLLYNFAAESNQ